ncbi:hypothetical protein JCM10213_000238 [Rhodosporidiobolus nylandii]
MPPFFPSARGLLRCPCIYRTGAFSSSDDEDEPARPASPPPRPAKPTKPHLETPHRLPVQKEWMREPFETLFVRDAKGTMGLRRIVVEEEHRIRPEVAKEEKRELQIREVLKGQPRDKCRDKADWEKQKAYRVFDNWPLFVSVDSLFATFDSLFPSPSYEAFFAAFLHLLTSLTEIYDLHLPPAYLDPSNRLTVLRDLAAAFDLFRWTFVVRYYAYRPIEGNGRQVMGMWETWLRMQEVAGERSSVRRTVNPPSRQLGSWGRSPLDAKVVDYLAACSSVEWTRFVHHLKQALRNSLQEEEEEEEEPEPQKSRWRSWGRRTKERKEHLDEKSGLPSSQ